MSDQIKGVVNGADWEECTDIQILNAIPLESLGPRHHPISHGMVLESFLSKMNETGILSLAEKGLLSKDKLKYIYVVEMESGMSDYSFKLGFINYNNKERALTGIAGENVFVCSNECFDMFSGLVKGGKRKHTKNMIADLEEKMDNIFEYFEEYQTKRNLEIESMKNIDLTARSVGAIVLDLHRNSSLAGSLIGKIIKEWDEPSFDYDTLDSRTVWDFINACTHCIKQHKNPLYRIEQQAEVNKLIMQYIGR